MKQMRQEREKWQNQRSDAILYANMLVDYFNFVNFRDSTDATFGNQADKIERQKKNLANSVSNIEEKLDIFCQ